MFPYATPDGFLRGAQAIADYLNGLVIGGRPVSRAAVYRMVETGKIPVKRLGEKRSEIWARKCDLDRLLGMSAPEERSPRQAA
jgi:hypothetical protein